MNVEAFPVIQSSKIFVAGHNGLVGSAIVRCLRRHGLNNILIRTREELDLRDSAPVRNFFESEKPEFVILAAAKVGGIGA
ncbi:MAG: NAD-dependent epimerase/dehydratase, partial [Bacteriovoracaceae bacterium]|nr:NAD-dependent epimerase/dehydratase [Bacteriovoracaceae bacterium]